MQLYNGLDYLKIAVANAAGKDKYQFEERITWFENNIHFDKFTSTKELEEFVKSGEWEEPELLFTGLLAYRDYLNQIPSGYRCQLDAICSGASIMSAITCDPKGLEYTGLIGNKRADLYTEVYNQFLEICPLNQQAQRNDIKKLVMQFLYGSSKIVKKTAFKLLGYSHASFEKISVAEEQAVRVVMGKLVEAIKLKANGAYVLQTIWTKAWDSIKDYTYWILPDGFSSYQQLKDLKEFEFEVKKGDETIYKIPYQVKVPSTLDHSVSNCANVTHSLDGMIVREMIRRCMPNKEKVQQALHYLTITPPTCYAPAEHLYDELDKLVKLAELSKFVPTNMYEHIIDMASAARVPCWIRDKLIERLVLLDKQPYFEIVAIHDCFTFLPNNGNYVRHWYKEILAELVESDLLVFMTNQLPTKKLEKHPVPYAVRQQIAAEVRKSNYGIC